MGCFLAFFVTFFALNDEYILGQITDSISDCLFDCIFVARNGNIDEIKQICSFFVRLNAFFVTFFAFNNENILGQITDSLSDYIFTCDGTIDEIEEIYSFFVRLNALFVTLFAFRLVLFNIINDVPGDIFNNIVNISCCDISDEIKDVIFLAVILLLYDRLKFEAKEEKDHFVGDHWYSGCRLETVPGRFEDHVLNELITTDVIKAFRL